MKKIIVCMSLCFLVSCGNTQTQGVVLNSEVIEEISQGVVITGDRDLNPELLLEDTENISWRGEYYTESGNMLEVWGPSADGQVDFELYYPSDSVCSGASFSAYLEKKGVANFYDDASSCQINLTYNPGIIEVSTYDCGSYEDLRCGSLSGEYIIK